MDSEARKHLISAPGAMPTALRGHGVARVDKDPFPGAMSHTCPRKAVGMAPKFSNLFWRDA
jgi:hypothetical protein